MTGFSQDARRYYEKIGPLAPIRRSESGHRRYAEVDLAWARSLTILRATGMPIRRMLTFVESSVAQPEHSPPHGHMGLPQARLPAGSTTVTRQ